MRKYLPAIAVWMISAFIVLVFMAAGIPKIPDSSGWARVFLGRGFPGWFRIVVGAIEAVGSFSLLIARTAVYGAGALALIVSGAIGTRLMHSDAAGLYHELAPLGLLVVVAYLRTRSQREWRTARAHATARRSGPMQF